MLRRIIFVFFTIPIAIALIALAVANRTSVPISLDIINPGNPTMTWSAPMFVWLFAAMAVGVILGGVATWFTQGKHRKLERQFKRQADELRYEVEDAKKKAERDGAPGSSLVMSG
ncbi:MAG: LapA family protein [Pseudomonadota bacterium]